MSARTPKPAEVSAPRSVDRRTTPLAIIVALYLLVCLIWGSNWIAIKQAVTDMPPLLAAGMRFLVAGPPLIALCLRRRVPLRFPPGLGRFAIFVTIGYFCIPFLLFNVAETYISAGLTAICFSTVSVLIVLLSVPVLGTRLRLGQVMGVLIAFGALVLLISNLQVLSVDSMWGVAAALTAAAMHSFAYVNIKKHGGPVSSLTLNTLPMIAAGLLLSVTSLVVDRPGWEVLTARSVLLTVHLGLVASVVGLVTYFWLLQRLSAATASFVFIIFPVIAQVIAVTVEGIDVTAVDVLLLGVILGAFTWTQLSDRGNVKTRKVAQVLTPDRLAEINAEAIRHYPAECCGFVRDSGVYPCENVVGGLRAAGQSDRTATTGYAFRLADLLTLDESLDSDDPARCIYHSHPDAGAYFSAEDERFAVTDGSPTYPVDHLVVDVTADGVRGSRLFRFDPETGRYVEAASFGAPRPLDGGQARADGRSEA